MGSEEQRQGAQPRGGISSSEKRGGHGPGRVGSHSGMGVSDQVPLAPGQGGGWNGGFHRSPISISVRVLTQALPAPPAKMGNSG